MNIYKFQVIKIIFFYFSSILANPFQVPGNIFKRIFTFYYDGFRSMTVGRKLWLIILIKLFVFFAILKLFFFPDFLESRFNTEVERSDYVMEQLTQ